MLLDQQNDIYSPMFMGNLPHLLKANYNTQKESEECSGIYSRSFIGKLSLLLKADYIVYVNLKVLL